MIKNINYSFVLTVLQKQIPELSPYLNIDKIYVYCNFALRYKLHPIFDI